MSPHIDRVAVVGCGLIGSGWASWCLAKGRGHRARFGLSAEAFLIGPGDHSENTNSGIAKRKVLKPGPAGYTETGKFRSPQGV